MALTAFPSPILSSPPPSPVLSSRFTCRSSLGLIHSDASLSHPVIKRHVSGAWLMWHASGHSIHLSTSLNGIHWRGSGTGEEVLGPSPDWWVFDRKRVVPCDVMIMSSEKVRVESSVYWMYYTGSTEEIGGTGEGEGEGDGEGKFLPGLAISQDGENWARIEGPHHSGALFSVGEDEDDWASSFISGVSILYHNRKDLRMYFHSLDRESGLPCVGIARSMDGVKWVKLKKLLGAGEKGAFDECGVKNPRVVKNDMGNGTSNYLMVYEGLSADGRTSVGLAESENGLKEWRRGNGGEPVLEGGEEGEWDCGGVGAPSLVRMGSEWRLYYEGRGKDGGAKGVGMAVLEGGIGEGGRGRFEKWKGLGLV